MRNHFAIKLKINKSWEQKPVFAPNAFLMGDFTKECTGAANCSVESPISSCSIHSALPYLSGI